MSNKFLEWAQTEANRIVAEHKSASPAVQAVLAERLWVLELVATKYKELNSETGTKSVGRDESTEPSPVNSGGQGLPVREVAGTNDRPRGRGRRTKKPIASV